MGGSTDGDPQSPPVSYSTVHRVEVLIRFSPGGGIPGGQMQAAQNELTLAVEQYGSPATPGDYLLDLRGQGVAALVAVVDTSYHASRPPGFPEPLIVDQPEPADGMVPGPGFGRAGAG